ncbi:MAG: hypothetical protein GXO02_06115, partial [Epsilonproteobacteria bacterium]|nr:hypothetical protein [Campylobacterota bacterium]
LWQAKGIYSKLQALTSTFPNSGRRAVRLERRKLALSLENLSDKELNRILGKLASLPIRFKQLDILRSNDKFRLECLCNW